MDEADWQLTYDMIKLLEPFHKTTTVLQSRHEPTLSYVLPAVSSIKQELSMFCTETFFIFLESINTISPLASKVKQVLLQKLYTKFEKFLLVPEYFIAMVTNPCTKSLLSVFEKPFQELIIQELQRCIFELDSYSENTAQETVDYSTLLAQGWLFGKIIPNEPAQKTDSLIEEWMKFCAGIYDVTQVVCNSVFQ
ncbi:MAG: hypothetical protein ACXV2C_06600 [Candidatus Bathyarchaeia archaeon]